MSNSTLITPELLRRLEQFQLLAARRAKSAAKGERRSRARGQSVEFADYRNYVVGDDKSLVVPDIQRDPRFADNETIKLWGVRFYAGAPLRVADGLVIGALCILDPEPRTLEDEEVALLETMAADVAAAIAPSNADEASVKAPPAASSVTVGQQVPESA